MNLDQKVSFSPKLRWFCTILVVIGIVASIVGFAVAPNITWANYLLNNFYFLSIVIGALFFLCLQYITNSGWSAAFLRIPIAMGNYLPLALLFFLIFFFGLHSIYHWTHTDIAQTDPIIAWKRPYLNVPFLMFRILLFFSIWILLHRYIKRLAKYENSNLVRRLFNKKVWLSRVYIFAIALTFPFFVIDMILSIDTHWFSALFALKNFVAAFYHGTTIIALIAIILYKLGYIPFLNKSHLHDFARYIFKLSIIWGYFWFAQYMLIWYGNIPEETVYFVTRWKNEWVYLFFANLTLNWAIPFIFLMPRVTSRSVNSILAVIIILIVGQYSDLYLQIMPGAIGYSCFGWINIGMFLGFAGLFIYFVTLSLSRMKLFIKNHPYLEESIKHHF